MCLGVWPEKPGALKLQAWFPPPALTLVYLQLLGGRGWALAAKEETETGSLVLTWLLEGPTKTDMLSEADMGRTEHTAHQSAVLDTQGKNLPVAWDFKRLDRTVKSEWEPLFQPAQALASEREN